MSLKDEIRYPPKNQMYGPDERERYDVAVLPVAALREWLESHLKERRYGNAIHNSVIDDLLAELEGL